MSARGVRRAIGVALLLVCTAAVAADVPYLTGRVVDDAEILSPAVRAKLADDLKAHEDRTTNQIAVLTVKSLGGDSVEDFATRVFESWKLGRKGQDNGVLVIVAPADRRMRIEVGYGLEGTLTDAAAARIIRDRMTPRFKADDFDGGVRDGVAAILATLEGRAGDAGGASADVAAGGARGLVEAFKSVDTSEFEKDLPPWPMRILLGCFIFGIIGLFTIVGVATPGMGWFLYLFLIPFWAMFPIVVVGVKATVVILAIYLIGFPIAKLILSRRPAYQKAAKEMKTKGSTTFGGMVITSGSSSSGGSSGSSGGGFSGGGGSSGGGGASGSW